MVDVEWKVLAPSAILAFRQFQFWGKGGFGECLGLGLRAGGRSA